MHWVRFYPLYGGVVRRQIRRMYRGGCEVVGCHAQERLAGTGPGTVAGDDRVQERSGRGGWGQEGGVRINWVVRFRSPGFLVLGDTGDPEIPVIIGVPRVPSVPEENSRDESDLAGLMKMPSDGHRRMGPDGVCPVNEWRGRQTSFQYSGHP